MILQYEILAIGLKSELREDQDVGGTENEMNRSMGDRFDKSILDDVMVYAGNERRKGIYNKFSNYFVDDKENLKDIMEKLGNLNDDEIRIKEELFMLIYFFIMTFNKRTERIKNIIIKNKGNLCEVIREFMEQGIEDDTRNLLNALINNLEGLSE
jgi:hypothetical protein